MKFFYFILISSLVVFILNQIDNSFLFEKYYLNGLYQGIRAVYFYTLYHLPFGVIYIAFPIAFYFLITSLRKSFLNFKSKKYKIFLVPIISFALTMYVLFYILWGFNYKVNNLETRLQLSNIELDSTIVINEIKQVLPLLEEYRNKITLDTSKLDESYRPNQIENILRITQKSILSSWNIPNNYDLHVRTLNPKGILLVLSTSGIYIPYAFEGHYDAGLSHIQTGFVIAHEMAHGYGITSEADCNFLALLTCLNSDNDYLKYTGLLTYWRYLMSELKYLAPYSYYYLAYHRPLGLRNDIKEIYRQQEKYPDLIPTVRDYFYDNYLKLNGVDEGLESYARVINLYVAWKTKNNNKLVF